MNRFSFNSVRASVCVALFAIWFTPLQAQEPKIRASLATQNDIWVGQRLKLIVELLAPGFFSGTPAFELPDPPGILLVPPRGSPVVSSEEIDGTSYTVQRHELWVVSRVAGKQTIPPLTVRFGYKRQPLDTDVVQASVTTTPLEFTVKTPPGAEHLGSIISARDLTVTETWQPEPGKAKAGDAFTRTVTFSAPDVPAMSFPPFPAGRIDGLGVYANQPAVLDHSDRGEARGERRDAITYVCKSPGQYVIPAVRLSWFNLDTQELQTIELPERTLDVAPNPALAAAHSAPETNRFELPSLRTIVASLIGAIALSFCIAAICRNWSQLIAPFRPVPLAPLNPTGVQTGRPTTRRRSP
jgi:hypothetical protein